MTRPTQDEIDLQVRAAEMCEAGRLVEAAWLSTVRTGSPVSSPEYAAVKAAYFMGADYVKGLFMLTSDQEWTDAEIRTLLKRLDNEMTAFKLAIRTKCDRPR